jgi:hypothetical protein
LRTSLIACSQIFTAYASSGKDTKNSPRKFQILYWISMISCGSPSRFCPTQVAQQNMQVFPDSSWGFLLLTLSVKNL